MKSNKKHKPEHRKGIRENIMVFLTIFVIFYGYIFISQSGTRCYFKSVTGIPCPSCGMTRSYIHLFHGEWNQAFMDHPLFWTVPIIFISAFIMYRFKSLVRLNKFLTGLLIFFTILFILVYIYRMINLFPDTDPLKFYDRGLIPRLYRFVKGLIKS